MREANQSLELARLIKSEWLLTNGLGGYASSTLSGINTRKYHGLAIGGFDTDGIRRLYVGGVEEKLIVDGHAYLISTHKYLPDAVYPMGYLHLREFGIDERRVWWSYGRFGDHPIEIHKQIQVADGINATWIQYQFSGRKQNYSFDVQPLMTCRSIHAVLHDAPMENERGDEHKTVSPFTFSHLEWDVGGNQFGVVEATCTEGPDKLYLICDNPDFRQTNIWYYDFFYDKEQARGYDPVEDLYSPGAFWRSAKAKEMNLYMVLAPDADTARMTFEQALRGWQKPLPLATAQTVITNGIGKKDTAILSRWFAKLGQQSKDFVVKDHESCDNIIAGYPWFGIWSRDALLSFDGLLLQTGKLETARNLLVAMANSVHDGQLPNIIEEKHRRYDFVGDSPLLFVLAVYQYWLKTHDSTLIKRVWSKCEEILVRYIGLGKSNPRTNAHGLIEMIGDGTQAATWMDAIANGRAITPRYGAPVELQALWYNALKIAQSFDELKIVYSEHLQETISKACFGDLEQMLAMLKREFERHFWSEEKGFLADFIHDKTHNLQLRPNQLFSTGLPFPILDKAKAGLMLQTVEAELLTRAGLRTLSPRDSHYRADYAGDQVRRDEAYHQGTIWPWLLGLYYQSILYAGGNTKESRQRVLRHLVHFLSFLEESQLNYIPEIFAAASLAPHGTTHQAWNVGQIYSIMQQILQPQNKQENE